MKPDPGGPKTCGSGGSRSGSATLAAHWSDQYLFDKIQFWPPICTVIASRVFLRGTTGQIRSARERYQWIGKSTCKDTPHCTAYDLKEFPVNTNIPPFPWKQDTTLKCTKNLTIYTCPQPRFITLFHSVRFLKKILKNLTFVAFRQIFVFAPFFKDFCL